MGEIKKGCNLYMKNNEPEARRKVMFVLPSLSAGGAERVLITLMNGLDQKEFAPVFVHVMSGGGLKGLIDPSIKRIDLAGSSVVYSLPALFSVLRSERPDIVVSTMAHMNFVLLLLRPFFKGVAFVVREAIVPSYILDRHPYLSSFIRLAYQILYRNADAILSPSQRIIDEFQNMLGMKGMNHVLLYNPVDVGFINKKLSELHYSPKNHRKEVQFVASGRLENQKGFDRLILALKDFHPRFNWRLSILGDGSQKKNLQTAVDAMGLRQHVFLLGHKENPWTFYRDADCFLLPSRWEGLPNVVLESLVCGTPVIAMSEAGGIQEIADKAGRDNVCIVCSMEAFIKAMEGVEASTIKEKTGLLPADFDKNHIMGKFAEILTTVSVPKNAI